MTMITARQPLPTIYAAPRFALAVFDTLESSLLSQTREEQVDYDRRSTPEGGRVDNVIRGTETKLYAGNPSDTSTCSRYRTFEGKEDRTGLVDHEDKHRTMGAWQQTSSQESNNPNPLTFSYCVLAKYDLYLDSSLENANGHDASNTMSVLARLRKELRV